MSKKYLTDWRWLGFSLLIAVLAGVYFLLQAPATVNASLNRRTGFSGNPATNDGATCTACHATGAAVPDVTLQGPATVIAGTTNLYTLTISGGPAQTGGLNISTSNSRGVLLPAGPDTQVLLNELTHSAPKAFNDNETFFTFTWTAPAFNDTVTMYAAGNSSDGQQNLSGDGIGTTTLEIEVIDGNGGPPTTSPTPPPPTLDLDLVVSGLTQPTDITHAGDSRLFVTEKIGRIHIIQNGALLAVPFLDITGRVAAGEGTVETGLLGLAFHPSYTGNGYFYVNYNMSTPLRTRISRFNVSLDDPNIADPDSELVLMEFRQPFNNHNGGQLQFGADGYLYIASGDGGSSGDPNNYAQNNNVLLGKILRIDVDGATGNGPDCDISGNTKYWIPLGNPFADGAGGACDEIWASGLRNPWRFSFDRITGDLWIADVGQNRFEEINFVPGSGLAPAIGRASNGGENYGWRCYEGVTAYNTTGCQPANSYIAPIHVYNRNQGDCSVTGGYVYRGDAYLNLNGHYFFSDFCNKSIRSIIGAPESVVVTTWATTGGGSNPITFGQDLDGELYVGYFSGEIYHIQGLSAPSTATPQPTNTPLPTSTPTATSTTTSTATPTSSSTATPTPTATPTGAIVRAGTLVVGPNQPFSASLPVDVINIPSNTQLGAVTVEIKYDATQLAVDGCGPAADNRFDSVVCNANETGVARISALSTTGLTGDAVVALLDLQTPGDASTVAPLIVQVITFVDTNAVPLAASLQNGAVVFRCRRGDVNCDNAVTPGDALFIVQHNNGQRPASDTIPPPNGFLYLAACDVNGDQSCTVEDARLILACEVGEQNELCNEGG